MKSFTLCLAALLLSLSIGQSAVLAASIDTSTLSGTAKLACEAILCLSSSTRPGECSPSLSHYFGINKKKWSDTFSARLDFLNQCPVVSEPGMPSLSNAIVDGAGFCDAASLNRNTFQAYRVYDKPSRQWSAWRDGDVELPVCTSYDLNSNWGWNNRWDNENDYSQCVETKMVIDDRMPSRCLNYINHDFTDFETLKYVGSKYDGGKWVD